MQGQELSLTVMGEGVVGMISDAPDSTLAPAPIEQTVIDFLTAAAGAYSSARARTPACQSFHNFKLFSWRNACEEVLSVRSEGWVSSVS